VARTSIPTIVQIRTGHTESDRWQQHVQSKLNPWFRIGTPRINSVGCPTPDPLTDAGLTLVYNPAAGGEVGEFQMGRVPPAVSPDALVFNYTDSGSVAPLQPVPMGGQMYAANVFTPVAGTVYLIPFLCDFARAGGIGSVTMNVLSLVSGSKTVLGVYDTLVGGSEITALFSPGALPNNLIYSQQFNDGSGLTPYAFSGTLQGLQPGYWYWLAFLRPAGDTGNSSVAGILNGLGKLGQGVMGSSVVNLDGISMALGATALPAAVPFPSGTWNYVVSQKLPWFGLAAVL
jgi:hypothetical protein